MHALVGVAAGRGQLRALAFTRGQELVQHLVHQRQRLGLQARAQGDRLVLAVNDDASVSRLKGPGRPINSVDRRMAVLAGLGAVDWVVSFAEDTPENLLRAVRPDVLVKGGDYIEAVEAVVGQLR